jgi:hypothetical protein
MSLATKSIVLSMLTLPIIYSPGIDQTGIVPTKNYSIEISGLNKYSWEKEIPDYMKTESEHYATTLDQLNTMQDFVSNLIEKSTDIDPDILQIIDDEFWNII